MPRNERKRLGVYGGLVLCVLACSRAAARDLRIYWCDVEGGAATLIVTPSGESVLIDAGLPGDRDSGRIHRLATDVAGLERIDHMVVTHFDRDHYGGVADVAERMPIGRFYDPGLPDGGAAAARRVARYVAAAGGKRTVLKPGDAIPLGESGGAPLELRCLAAQQAFVEPEKPGAPNPLCAEHVAKEKDLSQNANSIVLLLSYGPFRFLDAADLTWELEKRLVCPVNLVGEVDVYQVDHHGLSSSNNPVLVRSVSPRVAIMNNGARKGCELETVDTLRRTPGIEAVYQLHRHVRSGRGGNTFPEYTANIEERCQAHHVELWVAADGSTYTVRIPSSRHSRTFATKLFSDQARRA